MTLPLKHPFTCLVNGPTGSGKSEFVAKLIRSRNEMISPIPEKIFWCYDEYQTLFQELAQSVPEILFLQGFPADIDKELNGEKKTLLVVDDLMAELSGNKRLSNLFSKGSHHRDLSIIFIQQNLFYNGKESKNIRLNCHYLVLFKSPSDRQQIATLARQMYPKGGQFIIEAYDNATQGPYSYLFLDHKPDTDDRLRLRTNIFPGEMHAAYLRKT